MTVTRLNFPHDAHSQVFVSGSDAAGAVLQLSAWNMAVRRWKIMSQIVMQEASAALRMNQRRGWRQLALVS